MRIEIDCYGCRLLDGETVVASDEDYDHVDKLLEVANRMGAEVEENRYAVGIDLADDEGNQWTRIAYGPEYRMPDEIAYDYLCRVYGDRDDVFINDVHSP